MNIRIKSTALFGLALAAMSLPGAARAQTGGTTNPPTPAAKEGGAPLAEQKFSLDLRDAPIREALEKLFRQAKVDFSLDNSVQGFVTLKVTDQSFENVLRLLFRGAKVPLTYLTENGVYFVKARQMEQGVAGTRPGSGVPGETRSPRGGASGDQTLVADQDGNRLIALVNDTFTGVRPLDVIQLTYLDPADIAQLFKIIQIPSFSRQGGAGGSGAGAGSAGGSGITTGGVGTGGIGAGGAIGGGAAGGKGNPGPQL